MVHAPILPMKILRVQPALSRWALNMELRYIYGHVDINDGNVSIEWKVDLEHGLKLYLWACGYESWKCIDRVEGGP